MDTQDKTNASPNFSILYFLAAIAGILTAWVVTGSVAWMIAGLVLGLLTAGFFINVLIKGREEA